jgi:transcriptional regulator with XRE-family HTH domain
MATACGACEVWPVTNANEDLNVVGEYIRKLYTARGLSRHRFAKLLGASYTTVLAWEREGARPTNDKVSQIITLLSLTEDEKKRIWHLLMQRAQVRPLEAQELEEAEAVQPVAREPDKSHDQDHEERMRALDKSFSAAFDPNRDSVLQTFNLMKQLANLEGVVQDMPTSAARRILEAAASLRARGQEPTMLALLQYALGDVRGL